MRPQTHTHTLKQAVERLDTIYIAFGWADALCQHNLIISMQLLRQLLGGEMLALLGGFICSRVMVISQCVALSNKSVPSWCVFGAVCVDVESTGIIISHFGDK